MEHIKLKVTAIAENLGMTLEELAEKCGINANHLKNVSCGRTEMTAVDLVSIATFTGISPINIQLEY